MRIPNAAPVDRISPLAEERDAASSSTAAGDAPAPKDTVSVSDNDELAATAAAVRKELQSSRSAHLANIEAAVRNGTYKPDPRLIAERILQSAALDAQIDATLRDLP